MIKKFLEIKKSGLFINIPGKTPFRTPAKIDITKVDINIINAELKKMGVGEYEIITEDIQPKNIVTSDIENKNEEDIIDKEIKKVKTTMLSNFLSSVKNKNED